MDKKGYYIQEETKPMYEIYNAIVVDDSTVE